MAVELCAVRILASLWKPGIHGTWTEAERILSRTAAIVSVNARRRGVIVKSG
jgi:hypothetical protein